jgi:hypothetical protein
VTDIAITPAARRAAHLPDLARREQALLSETLGSLFTRPDLDAEVSSALGYPDWPPPLTLLPDVAPSLTSATPQLDAYLPFAASACHEALTTLARDGWPAPSVPGAADAAWLLLQHADASNEDRHGLLPAVADAVRRGDADPRHLALLTDRTLVSAGKPQRYGTLRLIRDELPRLLYPLEGSLAHTDRQREVIGLPRLVDDARFAFSPLNPYGVARSCPTNAWQPEHAAALRPQPVTAAGDAAPPPVPDGAVGVTWRRRCGTAIRRCVCAVGCRRRCTRPDAGSTSTRSPGPAASSTPVSRSTNSPRASAWPTSPGPGWSSLSLRTAAATVLAWRSARPSHTAYRSS